MIGISPLQRLVWVGVAAGLLLCATPHAHAAKLTVDVGIIGGTMAEWDAFGEAGNAFGMRAGLRVGPVDVAVAVAGVMPDGRVQARFASFWAEGRWHPFMEKLLARDVPLSPFLLVGLGVAAADGAQTSDFNGFDAVRWTPDSAQPVVMAGVGLRYGDRTGMYGSLDARAYNLSHGGLVLAIGYAF